MNFRLIMHLPVPPARRPMKQGASVPIEEKIDYLESSMESALRDDEDLQDLCCLYKCLKGREAKLNERGQAALERVESLYMKYVTGGKNEA